MNELDVQIHQDDKDPFIKNFNGEDTQFKYADIYSDSDMLMAASHDVDMILKNDTIKEDKAYQELFDRCKKYFDEQYIDVL